MPKLPADILQEELIDMAKGFSAMDEPLPLRIVSAHVIGKSSEILDANLFEKEELSKYVIRLTQDMHRSVREAISIYLEPVCRKIGQEQATEKFLPVLCELLDDVDEHVKMQALQEVSNLIKFFDRNLLVQKLLPELTTLVEENQHSRDLMHCFIHNSGLLADGLDYENIKGTEFLTLLMKLLTEYAESEDDEKK